MARIILGLILILPSCKSIVESYEKDYAEVEIVCVIDGHSGELIRSIDIYVSPEDLEPGEDGDIFNDISPLVVIKIETGKCT